MKRKITNKILNILKPKKKSKGLQYNPSKILTEFTKINLLKYPFNTQAYVFSFCRHSTDRLKDKIECCRKQYKYSHILNKFLQLN